MKTAKEMSKKEMKEYLLSELAHEEILMMAGQPNNYSYLFMLCNDMGIVKG